MRWVHSAASFMPGRLCAPGMSLKDDAGVLFVQLDSAQQSLIPSADIERSHEQPASEEFAQPSDFCHAAPQVSSNARSALTSSLYKLATGRLFPRLLTKSVNLRSAQGKLQHNNEYSERT